MESTKSPNPATPNKDDTKEIWERLAIVVYPEWHMIFFRA